MTYDDSVGADSALEAEERSGFDGLEGGAEVAPALADAAKGPSVVGTCVGESLAVGDGEEVAREGVSDALAGEWEEDAAGEERRGGRRPRRRRRSPTVPA